MEAHGSSFRSRRLPRDSSAPTAGPRIASSSARTEAEKSGSRPLSCMAFRAMFWRISGWCRPGRDDCRMQNSERFSCYLRPRSRGTRETTTRMSPMTRATWMKPPIVNELTSPRSHNTRRMTPVTSRILIMRNPLKERFSSLLPAAREVAQGEDQSNHRRCDAAEDIPHRVICKAPPEHGAQVVRERPGRHNPCDDEDDSANQENDTQDPRGTHRRNIRMKSSRINEILISLQRACGGCVPVSFVVLPPCIRRAQKEQRPGKSV